MFNCGEARGGNIPRNPYRENIPRKGKYFVQNVVNRGILLGEWPTQAWGQSLPASLMESHNWYTDPSVPILTSTYPGISQ